MRVEEVTCRILPNIEQDHMLPQEEVASHPRSIEHRFLKVCRKEEFFWDALHGQVGEKRREERGV